MKPNYGKSVQSTSMTVDAYADSSIDTVSDKSFTGGGSGGGAVRDDCSSSSASSPSMSHHYNTKEQSSITIQSYNNNTHRNLFLILGSFGLLLSLLSLACGIPAWVLLQMYPRTVVGPNEQVMKNHQFLPLFATGVVLVGVEILFICILSVFSAYAMRHEKNEDVGLKTRFGRLNSERMTLTFMSLVCGILFLFLAFYIAFVSMVSKMSEKWYFLTFVKCPIDLVACKRVDIAMKLFQACSVLAMLSIVPLLMINTAAISHSGSHKTKEIPIHGSTSIGSRSIKSSSA